MTDEGELIAGRYRLLSRVGRGSMGVVWRARDERLDRVVAVKQLLIDAAADEADAEEAGLRAMREARVAARLRHPHAIMVHDVVAHQGKPCLIMEFLAAESLAALVTKRGTLPPDFVAKAGSQVASALATAHEEGIVHRDVTPGNVLITEDGTAKLADFGISRAAGEGTVTSSGFIVGTPAYLAPEVAGGAEAGFPSDVFALGATLYFALEGKPPYGTDENPIALLQRIAREEINPPQHAGPLTDVLLCLLRRDPEERPSMLLVREGLAAVAEGRPVPSLLRSMPQTRFMPLGPRRSRVARRLTLVAMIGVLASGGAALAATLGQTGKPAGQAEAQQLPPSPAPASTTSSPPASGNESDDDTSDRGGCDARYQVVNAWPGGYQVEVTVRNDEGVTLNGWRVTWALPDGHRISNLWNGTLSQRGSAITVTSADWNATVKAYESTSFGLTAIVHSNRSARQVNLTCREL
ncbi:MAG TPA: protein kinase [Amycolatopsis sp.]|uniref:protein kinase domain-containing protein n=1 Tax=Amycolatopsis sp. TaxID=37632 RepID=UPI002B49AE86|nr:protein kinase [Amycolatopsis sp.]HKS49728.1 protein kinase [Amycolatopsis sp.]